MTRFIQLLMLLIGETNILLLMFIVVMIASCFLGRSIVISKKCLLAGLGIVFLSVIVQFFETPIFKFFYPDVYAGLKQDPSNETLLRSFVQFETIGNALLSLGKPDAEISSVRSSWCPYLSA